jgi:hypothetical protein
MTSPSATPVQRSAPRGAHAPAEAQLAQYPGGAIVALSLSEPGRTYRVQLDPLSCECPGFQHRGCCYHVKAAVERFGEQAAAVEPEPRRYVCYSCGHPWSEQDGTLSAAGWHVCADRAVCSCRAQGVRAAYWGYTTGGW